MTLRKSFEAHHNTADEVQEWIEEALRIVGDVDVTDELRPIAFAKAVDLLAAKQIQYEAVQPLGVGLGMAPR